MNQSLRKQPDDPGVTRMPREQQRRRNSRAIAICPTCNQPWPDKHWDAERFLELNAGEFTPEFLARMLCWSLDRLKTYCRNHKPPIDLTLKKEPEPRGL